ncbi:SDR family oxidoreductase [Novosphingobium malaysiense]|uniref:Short-chain dehydrogenase n=1 Tax=Novosphingobium malaysiense TaxID=1348853 RepID=A0A0B1ZIP8_9SPHN|nr:SDR family oxidoreductase [Novosphingobium malaysiense]KHK90407.1 short-chain dehydrogenase [Novosphingobium malaysiense]
MDFSIDQFRLDGKVAIVTGGGGRGNSIGRAYAVGLANAGASVVVADLNEDGAKAIAAEITAAGGRAIGVKVDVADRASTLSMAQAAQASFGGVDILVNNAALMVELGYEPVENVPLDAWNKMLDVNLTGALLCSQAVIPMMRTRGGGRIVNQSSGGAFPATSIYGVGKIALVGLTTALAKQLGKEGITCNAIAPGSVSTDAGNMLLPDDSPFLQYLDSVVAGRARGTPDELVGALMLLCSSAGAWITGQTLHVDGGWVIRP